MQPKHPLKILVVDDARDNLIIIRRYLFEMGHIPLTATNGREAIERFQAEAPDLVLMDVMMPDVDGYEATARIKALNPGRWIPVVFLSALDQEDSVVKGLDAGGDDYLTKPVHFLTLRAKINAMQRIVTLQGQIRDKAAELEQYYCMAEEEKKISSQLMNEMASAPGLQDAMLRYWIAPAEHYSGDLVAAARSPSNVLYALLGDSTGHGLAAAIHLLPLPHVFYSMVNKGFSLPTIAEELNKKTKSYCVTADRFVAATLAAVDIRNKVVEVWNGGNPDTLFIDGHGRIQRRFESRHLPLGILAQDEFDSSTEFYHFDEAGQLLLGSDGLVEAENAQYQPFGWDRVLAVLGETSPEQRFENLQAALASHLAGHRAGDDIALMLIDIPEAGQTDMALPVKGVAGSRKPSRWKMEMDFGAEELRYLDVVPHLISAIEKMEGISPHLSPLFLIVSELFSNALDHGLLALDSNLKCVADGFDRYLAEKEKRLAELEGGSISVGFEQMSENNGRLLKIRVKDSGAGFNHAALNSEIKDNVSLFGRGIELVRSVSTGIEYLGCGNEVVVHYRF